ncbi:DUF4112 domain-containing protein [Neisseria wadsworthii]|uniref:DUF4112 domain-containing protein n=1 Tax=Neisseria wadsworthii 9715 TaxID=1030841 RepID=G4CNH2_9NEIS|nr:DUF4112 domain-containing protein [Neisseria wadsworthii]EGZ49986.1 hypothetical protein HMPREF9370_0631 [Neisseria wadsworthii 9715]QMT36597.1 DUF4112 domain-containing protein [Neisseria wadsworthii]
MNHPKRLHSLQQSRSYHSAKKISYWLDDNYLDGIIGLVPVAGDILSQSFHAVFLYLSAVKLRSARLTLVILFNSLLDIFIGLIPLLGEVLDFVNKSYKRNLALIEGFAAGDKAVVSWVNRQAAMAAVGIVLMLAGIVMLAKWTFSLLAVLYHWLPNLF